MSFCIYLATWLAFSLYNGEGKGTAVSVQALTDREGFMRLNLADLKTIGT
jgi:hypothetical protein